MKAGTFLLATTLTWTSADAQTVVSVGTGFAHNCFVYAKAGIDPTDGVELCNQAILLETLSRKDRAHVRRYAPGRQPTHQVGRKDVGPVEAPGGRGQDYPQRAPPSRDKRERWGLRLSQGLWGGGRIVPRGRWNSPNSASTSTRSNKLR